MPAVQVECPNCRKSYSIDSALLGNRGRCRGCGAKFSLTASSSSEAPPSEPAEALPAKVGRFAVRSRLGSGAFGAVYRAHDPDLDREVALKVPHPGSMGDSKSVERFLREAKAAARLRHPNIVPVFEIGVAGANYYIASAFIPGQTLADLLEERGPLDFRRAAEIVADLADALQSAHDQTIVHRDVKPLNVMIDESGRPMLMDFGLACWDGSSEKLTQDGAILGTPAYMAPEQATGHSAQATPATDQYALGVTLYELLCGRVPFSGPIALVIFNAVHTAPPPLNAARRDVPKDLEAICLKAMAKKPGDRFDDARALASALREWLSGKSTLRDEPFGDLRTVEIEPEPIARLPRRAATTRNRPPRPLLLGAAGVMAAIAALALWPRRGADRPGPAPNDVREGPIAEAEANRVLSVPSGAPSPPVVSVAYPPLRPQEIPGRGLPVYHKAVAPRLDGAIAGGEYGPPLPLSFAKNANPGKIIAGTVNDDDDLSAELSTAYTDTDLYIAVKVRDDRVYASAQDSADAPWRNDGVGIFIDGDLVPNDWEQRYDGPGRYGPEGFNVALDVNGRRTTCSNTFGIEAWESKVARTEGGYVAEFRIPLALIDTKDGPEVEPARAGSTLGTHIVLVDREEEDHRKGSALVTLWHAGAIGEQPHAGDESRWKARLRLVPPAEEVAEPSSPARDPLPEAGSLATTGFPVPYRDRNHAPIADRRIAPDEYGPPLKVKFGSRDFGRLFLGKVDGPEDLSAEVRAAYTDTDLWIAVSVRDQFLKRDGAVLPFLNDSVEIYLDGDLVANDFVIAAEPLTSRGSREGFQLIADVDGRKLTGPGRPADFGSEDWQAVADPTDDGGYLLEFRIPLAIIDTKDGPGVVPAGPGSTLGFNMMFNDDDAPGAQFETVGLLWRDAETLRRTVGKAAFPSEKEFLARLYLVPPGS